MASQLEERKISPANFFLIRTASLPYAFLEKLRNTHLSKDAFVELIEPHRSHIEEAVYVASDSLYRALFVSDQWGEEQILSLAKYLNRMSARATPYGSFAAVGVGAVGENSNFEISTPASGQRVARLDLSVVGAAQVKLFDENANLEILRLLSVRLNSSICKIGGAWRYVEAKRTGKWTQYELARITDNPGVSEIAECLQNRSMRFVDLASELSSKFSKSVESAEDFILRLVKEQLLVAGPELAVTGFNPVRSFVEAVSTLDIDDSIARSLVRAQNNLDKFDGTCGPIDVKKLDDIADLFAETEIKFDRAKVVQVDLHLKGCKPVLSKSVLLEIESTLTELSPLLAVGESNLSEFSSRFERHYGSQRVPMLEALDEDFGIGFRGASRLKMPLLQGIPLRRSGARMVELRDFDVFAASRVLEVARNGESVLELGDEEIQKFSKPSAMPQSFTVLGTLMRAGSAPNAHLEFYLNGIFGPVAGALLGRFGSGNPELSHELNEFYSSLDQPDEDAGSLVAEIVHLPEGRVGNVVMRPVYSKSEIVYLGGAGVPQENQIQANQIDIECRGGVVYLWERSSGKRILPRMSNAHNFDNHLNLPVYRFLGAVAQQGEPVVGWSWGSIAGNFPWLPTVRYRNMILARERWTIFPKEISEIRKTGDAAIDELLARRKIPHHIRIAEGDNFLDLDLDSELDRKLFLKNAKSRPTFFVEAIPQGIPEAQDSYGSRYHSEIGVSFKSNRPKKSIVKPHLDSDRSNWLPGTKWLYAKLYMGPSASDEWLVTGFKRLHDISVELGCAPPFFIRYAENGNHLRVRISGETRDVWYTIRESIESSLQPFVSERAITRMEYATYQPEYDRYLGSAGIHLCEQIFAADSIATASAMGSFINSDSREEERWFFALQSLHGLALSLTRNVDDSIEVMTGLYQSYLSEFGVQRKTVDPIFRKNRERIDEFCAKGYDQKWAKSLQSRDKIVYELVERILKDKKLYLDHSTIQSILHMNVNRIMPEAPRANEMVLLSLATKTIKSQLARLKKK